MSASAPVPASDAGRLFAAVAASMIAGLAGCTMQTPLYPLYREAWQLGPATLTALYVCYMAGVIVSLIFFGRLSDQIGRIRVLRVALCLLGVALLSSAVAPSIGPLMVARTAIGLGGGLLTSTGAAALVETHPAGDVAAASLTTSAATIAGLGMGPLVSGLVVQFAPWPLVLPYLVNAAAVVVMLAVLSALMGSGRRDRGRRVSLAPSFRLPPGTRRPTFVAVGMVGFCGFAVLGLVASLVPSVLREVLGWRGPAMAGAVVTLLFCVSGGSQLAGRRIEPRRALSIGSGLLVGGLALIATSVLIRSGWMFMGGEAVAGAGQGLSFMAAMATANRLLEPEHRAGSLAAFLVLSYLGSMVPIVLVGVLAGLVGLRPAVAAFCLSLIALDIAMSSAALSRMRSAAVA